MTVDEFMRQALREVDAIGWSVPPVAPPPTREELARQETETFTAEMLEAVRRVRQEAGDDPYQQAAAEDRLRFMAQR